MHARFRNLRKGLKMQVNKISNNQQSFGMAFQVDTKYFAKASPSELEKLHDIVNKAGKEKLDKASKFVTNSLWTHDIKDGRINSVIIAARPENIKSQLKQLGDLLSRIIKSRVNKDPAVVVQNPYVKVIGMDDLTPEVLLDAVESTSKGVLDQFGSVERAESILGKK